MKWLTPIRRVSHFCPSHRLFYSTTLLPQNVLTEPLKKPVLNRAGTPIANYPTRITNQYRLHPVSQSLTRVFFYTFYDIFKNLIGFHHFDWKLGNSPTGKARKYGSLYCQFRPNLPQRRRPYAQNHHPGKRFLSGC